MLVDPPASVDHLMWRPGWVQLTAEEQVEAIRPFADLPAWVMDSLWTPTRFTSPRDVDAWLRTLERVHD